MITHNDYMSEFGYLYFDAEPQNGSLPAYVTQKPEVTGGFHQTPSRPRAPDEGGTAFVGYTPGGMARSVEDIGFWEKCPPGYKRSLVPPFKCTQGYYFGASDLAKVAGISGIFIVLIGLTALTSLALVIAIIWRISRKVRRKK